MGKASQVLDFRRSRRRQPFPIPADACRIIGFLGTRPPETLGGVTFNLRRCRRGVDIHFHAPVSGTTSFSWSVSAMLDVWLPNFATARRWVAAYAVRHGQIIAETKKTRIAKAVGIDRKALRSGQCHESWLSSDIPELWAEAMVRCQHPAGFCGSDGYCHYGTCGMVADAAAAQT